MLMCSGHRSDMLPPPGRSDRFAFQTGRELDATGRPGFCVRRIRGDRSDGAPGMLRAVDQQSHVSFGFAMGIEFSVLTPIRRRIGADNRRATPALVRGGVPVWTLGSPGAVFVWLLRSPSIGSVRAVSLMDRPGDRDLPAGPASECPAMYDPEDDKHDAEELMRILGEDTGEHPRDFAEPGFLESLVRSMLNRAIEDGLVTFMENMPSPEQMSDEDVEGVAGILRRALDRRGLL